MTLWLNFLFGVFVTTIFVEGNDKVICYYGTWATYRSGLGKFDVSTINTELCTHVIYTFAGIDNDGNVISLDPYLDLPDNGGRDNFAQFTALKKKNPSLKTILAVGGWNEGSAKYSTMAASTTSRANFVSSASKFVSQYGFDGLDIDWEYPNQRDSTHGAADVNNFSQLLKELRAEFDKHGLLITIAVAAAKSSASLSYDIPTVAKYVDIINLMTYDMYGAWDGVTGHNAPLHKGEGFENMSKDQVLSVDVAVEYWLGQGCPPEKLALGVPFYGRTFTLTDANVNTVRAPITGTGIAGPFTATSGLIGYNEFCSRLKTEVWDIRYDTGAEVPYAVQGRNWVSYDDPYSITKKVEYALSLGLAGIMVWSIETDDFNGVCGTDFPLLRAINEAFVSYQTSSTTSTTTPTTTSTSTTASSTTTTTTTVPTTTTTSTTAVPSSTTTSTTAAPSSTSSTTAVPSSTTTSSTTTGSTASVTTSTTTTTTQSTPSASICNEEGFASSPDDCSSFYVCVRQIDGSLEPKLFQCPKSLQWDNTLLVCNYEYLVKCTV